MRKIIKELCKDKYIWVFLLIAGITFFMTAFFYKTGFFPYTPIHSDGNGYYMYLPAWFVYHDPGMHFVQNLPPDPSGFSGTFFPMPTGQVVDKYTMGVAILQMPFFLLAHVITLLFCPEIADGFSIFYQLSNIASGCFYYFLGSICIYRLAKKYTDEKSAGLSVILITFGTGLFHYISRDGAYSHVYSYAMIALFMLLIDMHEERQTRRLKFAGGICFGLLTLVRVTNAVMIFLFVFYGVNSVKKFGQRIAGLVKPQCWGAILPGLILVWIPQLLYWKWAAGSFFVNSYDLPGNEWNEHFNWLQPELIRVLFMPNRGAFFWSPLLVFSVAGVVVCMKKKMHFQLGILISAVAFTYVTASWWAYDGLCGFTNRFFVDLSPLFIFGMALFFRFCVRGRQKMGIFIAAVILLSLLWTNLFMIEYWYHQTTMYDVKISTILEVFDWYIENIRQICL